MSKNPGGGVSSNPRPDEGENFANVLLAKSGRGRGSCPNDPSRFRRPWNLLYYCCSSPWSCSWIITVSWKSPSFSRLDDGHLSRIYKSIWYPVTVFCNCKLFYKYLWIAWINDISFEGDRGVQIVDMGRCDNPISAIQDQQIVYEGEIWHYREFSPYANFITVNFITAVFQNYY